MLGVKATREKLMQDCALRANFNIKPTNDICKTSDPLPELQIKQKNMVQFQKDPDLIEAKAKEPRKEKISTTSFHHMLGHACEDTTRLTAKAYGIHLTNKFDNCEFCARARRAQHRLSRSATNVATECGGRMFLDATTLNHPSLGGNKHLAGLTDEFSHKKFAIFLKRKSDLIENLKNILLQIYVQHCVTFKIIQMDNAGENLEIQKHLNNHPILHEMGTKIEYTAPFTPQQNGKIERVFPTLFARVRASY